MAKKFDWSAPLYCNPHIAVAVGAEAGIVYERLRWMIQDSKGKKTEFGTIRDDGRRWVDFTYAQLLEYLPIFKTTKSLRDVITKLEKTGLIDSESFIGGKWYTVSDLDPASLTKIVTPEPDKNRLGDDENRHSGLTKNDTPPDENCQPLIYKESETTSETTSEAVADSSSPTPSAPAAVVEEQEEISKSPVVLSEIEVLEKAYRDLCGVWEGSSKAVRAQVKTNLALLLKDAPHLSAADFEDFKAYYDAVTARKPHPIKPTPNFVTGGWQQFQAWQTQYLNETVWESLPGIDRSIAFTRNTWRDIQRANVGDFWRISVGFALKGYRKASDELWVEVPPEQWPDWAKESA